MPPKIGFVGVGRMGANMALRLKDVGYEVAGVFDIRREVAEATAQELGAEYCTQITRVTELSDIIITVVTDDRAMLSIYTNPRDNVLKGGKGKYFINCATLTPAVHVEVEKLARKEKAFTLEACMASSISQARDGTLYLMCGGSVEVYNHLRPVLEKLSKNLRYVGPAGTAAQVKALVNMVMNINTAGLAEGLALAQALKLDLTMVREIFSQTGANSRVLETDGEDMQKRDHACYFSAEHAAKDSNIALSLSRLVGLELPLADAAYRQYARMVKLGIGGLDKSGIAELTFKGRSPEPGKPRLKTGKVGSKRLPLQKPAPRKTK